MARLVTRSPRWGRGLRGVARFVGALGTAAAIALGCADAASPTEATSSALAESARQPAIHTLVGSKYRVLPDGVRFLATYPELDQMRDVRPGDVLVSAAGKGLLRGVAAVAQPDVVSGELLVATTAVALGDIVQNGSASDRQELRASDAREAADSEDPPTAEDPYTGFISKGSWFVSADGQHSVVIKQLELSFRPQIEGRLEMRDGVLDTFQVVAEGDFSATLDAEVVVNGDVSLTHIRPLASAPAIKLLLTVGGVPVPVFVHPSVGVGFSLEGSGQATMEATGSVTGAVRLGLGYDAGQGGWHGVMDSPITLRHELKKTRGTTTVAGCVYVYFWLDAMFFDVAGPYADVAPYVYASHTMGDSPWDFSVGFAGEVGALASAPEWLETLLPTLKDMSIGVSRGLFDVSWTIPGGELPVLKPAPGNAMLNE
jgi:hypothetical protein